VVVEYAGEAKRHGAVYLEAIFSPIERTWRGVSWDEIFTGYCDGVQEARELHGVEVRLTPDITRSAPLGDAHELVRHAARYRDRGIVAVGLGGEEAYYPNPPFAPPFREARAAGLGSVPHAGEVVGPESVRTAIDHLEPDRIRHGFRAAEDPALVQELVDRGLVLDLTPISNVRTGAVPSLEEHPLRELVAAGVRVSVSTDDPVMFDTDLTREYEAAEGLGLDPHDLFETALDGALCDDETKTRLRAMWKQGG
jgi:aminodeoxyfutalosine deaminase